MCPWCGGLELGEFFGAGPVLGGQLSEAPLDALPVLLIGLGVAGVVLLPKPGDEVLLAALDIADQRMQPRLACGPGVVVGSPAPLTRSTGRPRGGDRRAGAAGAR